MSNGESAYLALVLFAFAVFIGVVGFVSIWSRRPSKTQPMSATGTRSAGQNPTVSNWAGGEAMTTPPNGARSSRAA
jgi:hypothetical protein